MKFTDYLENETKKIDKTYDKTIFTDDFEGKPCLRDSVMKSIVASVNAVDEIVPIEGAYLVGKSITTRYDDNGRLIVLILIDKNDISDITHEKLVRCATLKSNHLAGDTQHSVVYKIKMFDGHEKCEKYIKSLPCAFDVSANKFVKEDDVDYDFVNDLLSKIESGEPNTLSFVKKDAIHDVEMLIVYKQQSIDTIKNAITEIQSHCMELFNEIKNSAVSKTEKSFAEKYTFDDKVNEDDIEKKFIKGDLSEKMAISMLKLNYYKNVISNLKKAIVEKQTNVNTSLKPSVSPIMTREMKMESEEKMSFMDFLTEERKEIKKLKTVKAIKDVTEPGKAGKHSKKRKHNDLSKIIRNNKRKKLQLLAKYREYSKGPAAEVTDEFSCENLIAGMKEVPNKIVPINAMQAKWVASAYHFNMPTKNDRIKRLSNMPMALYLSKRGKFYLVKNRRLAGIT